MTDCEVKRIKTYYRPNLLIKRYSICGRRIPTEKDPNPTVYNMKIFGRDHIVAKAKFGYFLRKLKKIRKSHCQVLSCELDEEKDTVTVKNYGVWFRWNSRYGTHNYYKEYRDIAVCGAVQQMLNDMTSSHRAKEETIQIIKTVALKDEECQKNYVKQFHGDLKIPLNKYKYKQDRQDRDLVTYDRPCLD